MLLTVGLAVVSMATLAWLVSISIRLRRLRARIPEERQAWQSRCSQVEREHVETRRRLWTQLAPQAEARLEVAMAEYARQLEAYPRELSEYEARLPQYRAEAEAQHASQMARYENHLTQYRRDIEQGWISDTGPWESGPGEWQPPVSPPEPPSPPGVRPPPTKPNEPSLEAILGGLVDGQMRDLVERGELPQRPPAPASHDDDIEDLQGERMTAIILLCILLAILTFRLI